MNSPFEDEPTFFTICLSGKGLIAPNFKFVSPAWQSMFP